MNEWMVNPQFEENIREAFDVPEIRAAFVTKLQNQIKQKADEKDRAHIKNHKTRFAWIIAAVVDQCIIRFNIDYWTTKSLCFVHEAFWVYSQCRNREPGRWTPRSGQPGADRTRWHHRFSQSGSSYAK